MFSSIDDFFKKNKPLINRKSVVLSIDLDNTLINRNRGANYVSQRTLSLLKKLQKLKNVILIPNTGRDIIGLRSFQKEVIDLNNAILGSGSLILHKGKLSFEEKSKIDKLTVKAILSAVKNNAFPFVDLYYKDGRIIIYNKNGKAYKDLFFSQNPTGWFKGEYPPIKSIEGANVLPDYILNSIFRIEFPVFRHHKQLYTGLVEKKEGLMNRFISLLPSKKIPTHNYTIKRKVFFNLDYKDKLIFARFEKKASFINKGIGLKKWFQKMGFSPKEALVIHLGDKDSGLINDTIVKKYIPSAHVVMVGDKCKLNNPLVSLYIRDDLEKDIYLFLSALYQNIEKK
jgi:hydroxymethylpyrimidine pyrophosphatase-like HAD family hydrolase